MNNHYLLWASGKDQPGIVAAITEVLFRKKCNLEDSSMMRLGSEFGVLLIFSSNKKISFNSQKELFSGVEKKWKLNIGLKPISAKEARFLPFKTKPFLVTVLGADQAGIVYKVTRQLGQHGFNVTDLTTHRTTSGKKPGYILFIEGEISKKENLIKIKRGLQSLQKKLKSKISIHPINQHTL